VYVCSRKNNQTDGYLAGTQPTGAPAPFAFDRPRLTDIQHEANVQRTLFTAGCAVGQLFDEWTIAAAPSFGVDRGEHFLVR
jgi:hypothetical protein